MRSELASFDVEDNVRVSAQFVQSLKEKVIVIELDGVDFKRAQDIAYLISQRTVLAPLAVECVGLAASAVRKEVLDKLDVSAQASIVEGCGVPFISEVQVDFFDFDKIPMIEWLIS